MTIESQENVYLTVKQFAAKYPWPSESALRAIIQDTAGNRGFSTAIKRFYRRILIDPKEFFVCLERMQNSNSPTKPKKY